MWNEITVEYSYMLLIILPCYRYVIIYNTNLDYLSLKRLEKDYLLPIYLVVI